MAAHQLAVAKASLASGLLRADPVSLSQNEIAQFHSLLDAALQQCSPPNVQRVKDWLVRNTIPSPKRTAQLGKYLAVLAQSFANAENGASAQRSKIAGASNKRRGMNILYILSDLHHYSKRHEPLAYRTFTSHLQPHLEGVVRSVASTGLGKNLKLHKAIRELLDVFEQYAFYNGEEIQKLRRAVDGAGTPAPTTSDSAQAQAQAPTKDAPYVMPYTHGDPADPWYDLPAANMMPHMIPNDPTPIPVRQLKPMRFDGRVADSGLVNAVKDLLKFSENLYNEDEGIVADIDMMGQPLVRDEITGELTVAENYYGWSADFCEKMKKRRKEGPSRSNEDRLGRGRSLSRSRSPQYKRRYSSSSNRCRSRSRSGKRMRDDARSYSAPRGGLGLGRDQSHGRGSGSPRRSRSRSPGRYRGSHRSSSRRRSRSRSYSPQHTSQTHPPPRHMDKTQGRQQPAAPGPYPSQQFPTPPPPPQSFPGQFNMGYPMGTPVPPPPPPNFNGAWPPPPPPMPINGSFNQQGAPYGQFPPFPPQMPPYSAPPPMGYPMSGNSPPPPPPPPMQPGFQSNQPWGQPQYGGYAGQPPNGQGQWQ